MEQLIKEESQKLLAKQMQQARVQRQIQVRQQALAWSDARRKKFEEVKEREIKSLANKVSEQAQNSAIQKIQYLTELHDLAMAEIGMAHRAAAGFQNVEKLKALKRLKNEEVAKNRGASAMMKVSQEKQVASASKSAILNRKKEVRKLEDLKSQEVISRKPLALTNPNLDLRSKKVKGPPEYQQSIANTLSTAETAPGQSLSEPRIAITESSKVISSVSSATKLLEEKKRKEAKERDLKYLQKRVIIKSDGPADVMNLKNFMKKKKESDKNGKTKAPSDTKSQEPSSVKFTEPGSVRYFDASVPNGEVKYVAPEGLAVKEIWSNPDAWERGKELSEQQRQEQIERTKRREKMEERQRERSERAILEERLSRQKMELENRIKDIMDPDNKPLDISSQRGLFEVGTEDNRADRRKHGDRPSDKNEAGSDALSDEFSVVSSDEEFVYPDTMNDEGPHQPTLRYYYVDQNKADRSQNIILVPQQTTHKGGSFKPSHSITASSRNGSGPLTQSSGSENQQRQEQIKQTRRREKVEERQRKRSERAILEKRLSRQKMELEKRIKDIMDSDNKPLDISSQRGPFEVGTEDSKADKRQHRHRSSHKNEAGGHTSSDEFTEVSSDEEFVYPDTMNGEAPRLPPLRNDYVDQHKTNRGQNIILVPQPTTHKSSSFKSPETITASSGNESGHLTQLSGNKSQQRQEQVLRTKRKDKIEERQRKPSERAILEKRLSRQKVELENRTKDIMDPDNKPLDIGSQRGTFEVGTEDSKADKRKHRHRPSDKNEAGSDALSDEFSVVSSDEEFVYPDTMNSEGPHHQQSLRYDYVDQHKENQSQDIILIPQQTAQESSRFESPQSITASSGNGSGHLTQLSGNKSQQRQEQGPKTKRKDKIEERQRKPSERAILEKRLSRQKMELENRTKDIMDPDNKPLDIGSQRGTFEVGTEDSKADKRKHRHRSSHKNKAGGHTSSDKFSVVSGDEEFIYPDTMNSEGPHHQQSLRHDYVDQHKENQSQDIILIPQQRTQEKSRFESPQSITASSGNESSHLTQSSGSENRSRSSSEGGSLAVVVTVTSKTKGTEMTPTSSSTVATSTEYYSPPAEGPFHSTPDGKLHHHERKEKGDEQERKKKAFGHFMEKVFSRKPESIDNMCVDVSSNSSCVHMDSDLMDPTPSGTPSRVDCDEYRGSVGSSGSGSNGSRKSSLDDTKRRALAHYIRKYVDRKPESIENLPVTVSSGSVIQADSEFASTTSSSSSFRRSSGDSSSNGTSNGSNHSNRSPYEIQRELPTVQEEASEEESASTYTTIAHSHAVVGVSELTGSSTSSGDRSKSSYRDTSRGSGILDIDTHTSDPSIYNTSSNDTAESSFPDAGLILQRIIEQGRQPLSQSTSSSNTGSSPKSGPEKEVDRVQQLLEELTTVKLWETPQRQNQRVLNEPEVYPPVADYLAKKWTKIRISPPPWYANLS